MSSSLMVPLMFRDLFDEDDIYDIGPMVPREEAKGMKRQESWMRDFAANPSLNVIVGDKEYFLTMDVPGVKKDDLKIKLTNDKGHNIMTVSGERKEEKVEENKETGYYALRKNYGKFSRSVRLPVNIKPEEINAKYEDGVLRVRIPKKESQVPQKVSDINIA